MRVIKLSRFRIRVGRESIAKVVDSCANNFAKNIELIIHSNQLYWILNGLQVQWI